MRRVECDTIDVDSRGRGDLGSTPLRLDGDDLRGPSFTIPGTALLLLSSERFSVFLRVISDVCGSVFAEVSNRDEVGRELDAKVARKKQATAAAKSKQSTRRPSSGRSATGGFSATRRSSVGLSPAAQRLLNSTPGRSRSSGGAMSDLRRTYASAAAGTRPGSSSRSTRPPSRPTSGRPSSSVRSGSGSAASSVLEEASAGAGSSSVTDNLLNI